MEPVNAVHMTQREVQSSVPVIKGKNAKCQDLTVA